MILQKEKLSSSLLSWSVYYFYIILCIFLLQNLNPENTNLI
jgi:hypothetical protein